MGTLNDCRYSYFDSLFRYFTSFDSSSSTYLLADSPVSTTSDMEVEFDAYLPDHPTNDGHRILGQSSANVYFLKIFNSTATPSNTLRWKTNTGSFNVALGSLDRSLLNNFRVVVSGGTMEVFLNGVSQGTDTVSGSFSFDTIGQGNGINYVEGVLANVRAWTEGTSSTGSLELDCPIEGEYSDGEVVANLVEGGVGVEAKNLTPSDSSEYGFKVGTGWYEVQNPANVLPVA